MRTIPCFWPLFLAFITACPVSAGEKIKIVTTIPTLKEFAQAVGGERAEVASLLKGGEDLHTFDPRPGDTRAVSDADVLVKVGIGLDGWVDRVIEASGNEGLRVIEASRGVKVIGAAEGHPTHIHGNPHVWLDPENAIAMVENIYRGMAEALPSMSGYFKANRDAYTARIRGLDGELGEMLAGIGDRRVVTYHPGWAYLLKRLDMKEVFSIERMPGREPSAREIARAIDIIKREKIKVIIGEPEAPKKVLDIISGESGAAVVQLAPEIGSMPEARSYMEMMRYNVGELAEGLKAAGSEQ